MYLKELPRVFKMTCSEITTIISRLQATPDSSMDELEAPTMNVVDDGVDMDLIDDLNNQVDNGLVIDMDFSEDLNDQVDGGFITDTVFIDDLNDLVDNDFDLSTEGDNNNDTSVDEPRDEMFIDDLVSSEESDLTDVSSYDEQDPDCHLFLIIMT